MVCPVNNNDNDRRIVSAIAYQTKGYQFAYNDISGCLLNLEGIDCIFLIDLRNILNMLVVQYC